METFIPQLFLNEQNNHPMGSALGIHGGFKSCAFQTSEPYACISREVFILLISNHSEYCPCL